MNGIFGDAILVDFVVVISTKLDRFNYVVLCCCQTERNLGIRCVKERRSAGIGFLESDEMLLQGGLEMMADGVQSRLKRNLVRPAEKTGGPSFER